jgi:hypothetical protein
MNGVLAFGVTTTEIISKPFCYYRKAFYIPTRIALGLLRSSSKIGLAKGLQI